MGVKNSDKLNIRWHTIISDEKQRTINLLTIYSKSPFNLNGVNIKSIAGFILGIQYDENDSRRKKAFSSWGNGAMYKVRKINKKIAYISWQGKNIVYASPEYYALIEQAIQAKFEQNPDAMQALISAKDLKFVSIGTEKGKKFNPLPSEIYCDILTRIRKKFV